MTLGETASNSDSAIAEDMIFTRTMYHGAFTPFAGLGIIF
jgi:hypothetical protein